MVAIKKVYQDKRYKNRELQIMKELQHPNVITLQHAFYTQGDKVSIQQLSIQTVVNSSSDNDLINIL